jgi:hypothetical protein
VDIQLPNSRLTRYLWLFACCGSLLSAGSVGCPTADEDTSWIEDFEAENLGWFLSVYGSSDDDIYAAGGSPEAGILMHFDGQDWEQVSFGMEVPLLNWIHGHGDSDLVVVGNGGTVVRRKGADWSLEPTPTEQNLWGVWGASPDDLWAVGGEGREEGQATILRYDGSAWQQLAVPPLERPQVWAFFKVWGTSADNVYIVGQRGAVLRWDGQELTELHVGAAEDLISIWGTGPDRIVAVGGRNNGIVSRYDGTEWTTESLAPLPGLNGVWMRSDHTVHIGGARGTLAILDFDSLHVQDTTVDQSVDFHALFGDQGGVLRAVGGNFMSVSGPYQGIAYRRVLRKQE